MSPAHTDKIILIFCEYKNHSKEDNSTIICDILNHSQENFVIKIKQISWSCPDPIFSKIKIQSWSKKIASILQDIQSWSYPCSPVLYKHRNRSEWTEYCTTSTSTREDDHFGQFQSESGQGLGSLIYPAIGRPHFASPGSPKVRCG